MIRLLLIIALAIATAGCAPTTVAPERGVVIISVVGTNDVHGELIPQPDHGGIVTFSGYVAALREARKDDGVVLLVDAGDSWQGTLESNLTEGAGVVEAYNALGYAAAAIGNHEFDFGPVGPKSIPHNAEDDPRGALRQRFTETDFPLLSANLIDTSTHQRVDWDNVYSATMLTREGIDIGIIGVMTANLLQTTIAANTRGIEVAPLADTIIAQAQQLRAAGASLVIVIAHAGGRCEEFDDPLDISSCNMSSEIMRVANEIPAGLVDHIVGGHVHRGIAHVVNGIAITASYSNSYAFQRVDFKLDKRTGAVIERHIFPPQSICARVPGERGLCGNDGDESKAFSSYEGRTVVPMPQVVAIANRAQELAAQRKAEKLGVYLESPMTLRRRPEAVLGNLMTDAILEMSEADVSIHNVFGGIRAELPEGELTFGSVFRMFPFDNRIAVIEMSGADLRRVLAAQVHRDGRQAGFSGMRAFVGCNDGRMSLRMTGPDDREIGNDDVLRVVVNDFLLMGGDDVLTPVMPEEGFDIPYGTPLVRDTLVEWFRMRGGRMNADDFFDPDKRRWNLPEPMPVDCEFSGV